MYNGTHNDYLDHYCHFSGSFNNDIDSGISVSMYPFAVKLKYMYWASDNDPLTTDTRTVHVRTFNPASGSGDNTQTLTSGNNNSAGGWDPTNSDNYTQRGSTINCYNWNESKIRKIDIDIDIPKDTPFGVWMTIDNSINKGDSEYTLRFIGYQT